MRTGFFQSKKPWSSYKDMILSYYLIPYLPKVCSLGIPVVVIDCFAGPGLFEDGTDGSPLIIAKAIAMIAQKGKAVTGRFIEKRHAYFQQLKSNLEPYQYCCNPVNGNFEDSAREIARLARDHSVFVYIDPYGIKSLRFSILAEIYANIQRGSSVEVLLNLNTRSIIRNGLAVLKCRQPEDTEDDEGIAQDEDRDHTMTPEDLDSIAGGKYWRDIVCSRHSFADMEQAYLSEYIRIMAQYFTQVCSYGVKHKYEHTIPKYRLIFGSRHPDAFVLMNDAVCNARDRFLGKQRIEGYLIDMRAEDEIHDRDRLQKSLLSSLQTPSMRKDLIASTMRMVFAEYKESEHKSMISELLKRKIFFSKSGKTRINDDEILSRIPFTKSAPK